MVRKRNRLLFRFQSAYPPEWDKEEADNRATEAEAEEKEERRPWEFIIEGDAHALHALPSQASKGGELLGAQLKGGREVGQRIEELEVINQVTE